MPENVQPINYFMRFFSKLLLDNYSDGISESKMQKATVKNSVRISILLSNEGTV